MGISHTVICVMALAVVTGTVNADVTPSTEEAVKRGLIYEMASQGEQYGIYGYGCGFADLDGDDDQDVIIIGRADGRVGIFENDGTGHFIDHTMTSGIPPLLEGSAFAAGNLVGDEGIDLYITQVGLPNVLARNDGGFAFTDVAVAAGVANVGASKAANLGDFDNDGRLDIYLANYGPTAGGVDITNALYHNQSDGTFDSIGDALGIDDPGLGFQGVWFDFDHEGDLDLYLSNDRGHLNGMPNRLWRNNDGVFEDISALTGAGIGLYSMGVACGDFDRNGLADLYCTNIPGGGGYDNPLLLAQTDGTYLEFSASAGVGNPYISWGSIFYDFNNDALLDLYVNNMTDPNALFINFGFPCGDFAAAAAMEGTTGNSYSSAVADVDGDGDLDLLLNNVGSNVQLFINHEGEQRNWARTIIRGQGANPSAVGARVHMRTGGTWQMQEIIAGGNGYLGQNELVAHFGLDGAGTIDEMLVIWPGGAMSRRYTDLLANRVFVARAELTGDVNADGVVNVTDLLRILAIWGPCTACGEDTDGNNVVDVSDLLNVLASWGQ